MENLNEIIQKIRKFNSLIEDIERMEKRGINDVTVASLGSPGRYDRFALDLSELGIEQAYINEILSPILTTKLAEQKKNLKAAIVELSKQLQELAGGAE